MSGPRCGSEGGRPAERGSEPRCRSEGGRPVERGNGPVSRRRLLASLGAIALPATLSACLDADERWERVEAPTEGSLYDVVSTAAGAVAVGEDGVVLRRDDGGWRRRLASGPGGTGDALRAADVTSNGRTLWAAGDSGVLGCYDVVADHVVDFSAPLEKTSSWAAVAVSGLAGSERIAVLNSSGELLRGRRDGGSVEWGSVTKPGTGSSVTAIDVTPLHYGYVVDTDGGVYESRDAGATWSRIGIDGAGVDFTDVAAVDPGYVSVAGGNGAVFTYDGLGWRRATLGEDPVVAIERDRHDALALGAPGIVYERAFDGWQVDASLDAGDALLALTTGTARAPAVVVGESGAIVERRY